MKVREVRDIFFFLRPECKIPMIRNHTTHNNPHRQYKNATTKKQEKHIWPPEIPVTLQSFCGDCKKLWNCL